jgi:acyl-coenzyme A synthetase/AMP-(fatty) acid ligase
MSRFLWTQRTNSVPARRLCRTQPRRHHRGNSLRKYLKDKVSRFEQPRDIKFVERIPRSPAGKVLRNELLA